MNYLVKHATWINGLLRPSGSVIELTEPQARRYVSSGMIVPKLETTPAPEPTSKPEPKSEPKPHIESRKKKRNA